MIFINGKINAAVSGNFPEVIAALESCGYKTLKIPPYGNDIKNPESSHADMQILKIGRKIVLLRGNDVLNSVITEWVKPLGFEIYFTESEIKNFKYPECVKLNIAVFGGKAVANFKYADAAAVKLLKEWGYKFISVNQGYAGCSTAVVSENAVITSDKSIHNAVRECGVDSLLITEGYIRLCERYGGFIGGASFKPDKNTIAFIGDLTSHPDCISIKNFCASHNVSIVSIGEFPLTDTGSLFSIK